MKGQSRFGEERLEINSYSVVSGVSPEEFKIKELIVVSDVPGIFQIMRRVGGRDCSSCGNSRIYEARRVSLNHGQTFRNVRCVERYQEGGRGIEWTDPDKAVLYLKDKGMQRLRGIV
ncbi:MAG: hypothetical protein AABX73_04625 [Nanoarchaeota archaeon]